MIENNNLGRRIFVIANYVFCILMGLICVMPVLHIFAVSFSSIDAVYSNHVTFWPIGFNMDNYNLVLNDAQFFRSYLVTIIRSAMGLVFSLLVTVLAAYPLAQKEGNFPARPFFVAYFMGAMLFTGGMVPTYLAVKNTGILDTIFALVLPCAVSTYNTILMMNFIKGIPDALSESAFLDGAGHFTTLFRVILPLCMPSIATISLFIILQHWNSWFDGMLYINNMNLKPLQTYLRSVVIVDASISDTSGYLEDMIANANADGSNGAKIFLALLPTLCIYPFLQKHFAKGIVRGSVKE